MFSRKMSKFQSSDLYLVKFFFTYLSTFGSVMNKMEKYSWVFEFNKFPKLNNSIIYYKTIGF